MTTLPSTLRPLPPDTARRTALAGTLALGACWGAIAPAKDSPMDPPPAHWQIPAAPVLDPEQALRSLTVEPGFRVELVAAEPLVHDPVALDIDERGRLWVVEMQSYMPDVQGRGEDEPLSRIMILEDTTGDGRMDKATVFMDNLVLPRTIAVVRGGIIYSTPPQLIFVENKDDKPGASTVIDPDYARGGNVEHQANGMVRALDNWRYNAKSDRRYRRFGDRWVMERTEGRGQWGICQDDQGRLFYNTNSSQLLGDFIYPSQLMRHPALSAKDGINQRIARSQQVWPARINPGVNRGYRPNQLTEDGYLASFTAASGVAIYRGDQFPPEYRGNAFIPEPSGNLVKRTVLSEDEDGRITGDNAYEGREFLASTDERFRPVNIYNAPDGTLLVVDMYRGIIQHRTYVTPYLRDQILDRGLDRPTGLGRIYRVVAEDRPVRREPPRLDQMDGAELVRQLASDNGWHRDTAQRLLIDRGDHGVVPELMRAVAARQLPLAQIHALWTLEGLGLVSAQAIAAAIEGADADVLVQALRVAETLAGTPAGAELLPLIAPQLDHPSLRVRRQLAFTLGTFPQPEAHDLLASLLDQNGDDKLLRNAALSGLHGRESLLLAAFDRHPPRDAKLVDAVRDLATKAPPPPAGTPPDHLDDAELAQFEQGRTIYDMVCMGCHQQDGQGMVPLAPPLVDSEWVTGDVPTLAKILLHGVTGPIEVAGTVYGPPDIQPLMPGLATNPEFDDAALAAVMTYVRNAWGNRASPVAATEVRAIRQATARRTDLYTPEELIREQKPGAGG